MRVLLVEDEAAIAKDIAGALGETGYVVDIARDGEEGWFRASTEDYDAIILDLGLPKLDGLSVVRRLRDDSSTVPILVLTARGSWLQRVEGIDAGALRIDTRRLRVMIDGRAIELSPLEFRLLRYLAHNRDRVVAQSELVEHVYGTDEPESNTIEALVARLRRKIGAAAIGTRRGHGYIMETPAP